MERPLHNWQQRGFRKVKLMRARQLPRTLLLRLAHSWPVALATRPVAEDCLHRRLQQLAVHSRHFQNSLKCSPWLAKGQGLSKGWWPLE